MAAPTVSRANVLGFRIRAQGLDRRPGGVDRVAHLGLQDTPYGSARAAWGQRVPAGTTAGAETRDSALVWSWRGAPHQHRGADLADLAEALWPVDDADATKRINTSQIKEGARRGLAAFTLAAEAMRSVVTEQMTKGEVSAAVSAAIPADLSYDCTSCGARHISGALFQAVGLAAGVQVVPQGRATSLEPLPDAIRPRRVPTVARGTAQALRRYVSALGPADLGQLAGFLGTTQAAVRRSVPDRLVEVDGPAGSGWVAEEDLDDLRTAEPPSLVRLLPPSDPWLQARDRDVIVPDRARQREVWKMLGNPGAVLVDGEVVGIWRAAGSGSRLTLTVTGFASLPAPVRTEVEAEAEVVATARGAEAAVVNFGG